MICRIKFGENQAGKFLSHLDMLRAWQRAISRSGLALAYSQGFNKHPKLSFSAALAVGLTSSGEYVDIELEEEKAVEEIFWRLKEHLPPAIEIYAIKEIDSKTPAIMSIVQRAEYQISLESAENIDLARVQDAVDQLLAAEVLEVERKKKNSREKKTVNIRPGIYQISVCADGGQLMLKLLLQNNNEGNVKPEEVMQLLLISLPEIRIKQIHRRELYTIKNGQMLTPLEV